MPIDIGGFDLVTVKEEPRIIGELNRLIAEVWPRYIVNAPTDDPEYPDPGWDSIFEHWPGFQFGLYDRRTKQLVAGGATTALAWDGGDDDLPQTGWDWAIRKGADCSIAGRQPKTLCALSATIATERQGQGMARLVLAGMRTLARNAGMRRLIAPVRPNLKARYPLIEMARYVTWRRPDGLPFDHWLRTHVRIGGRIIKPCMRSMNLGGPRTDWERWLGMALPDTGRYIGHEMLVPLFVDAEADWCTYTEPNVWVEHLLDP